MVMIAVVCIREMDMRMRHGFVPMPMRMPAAGRTEYVMSMLVVFLVPVFMGMLDGFVAVFVTMALSQVQPHTRSHQHPGNSQPNGERLSRRQREDGTEKRCHRKIGSRSGRSQVS